MRISNGTIRFDVPDEFSDRTEYLFEQGLDRLVAHYAHFAAGRPLQEWVDEMLEDAREALSGLPARPTLDDTLDAVSFAGADALRCRARITGPDGVTRADLVVTRGAATETFLVNAYCYGDSPIDHVLMSAARVSDLSARTAQPGYAWRWFGRFGFDLPDGFQSHTDDFSFVDDVHDVRLHVGMDPPAQDSGMQAMNRIVRAESVSLAGMRGAHAGPVYVSASAVPTSAAWLDRVWGEVVASVGPDR